MNAAVLADRAAMLPALIDTLRASRGFLHKHDIGPMLAALGTQAAVTAVPNGDDCAALPDGHGGHLLFAIEGLVADFIDRMPWFAGYSAVMVNVSDVYAMGGRPTAVVNAIWSEGMTPGAEVMAGMAAAAARYGVPIVGGHSNARSAQPQLAVAILGRAGPLLTSFAARPGDRLMMAVDLRGAWQEPFPYWNASTEAPAERLRADLELLPWLAEQGLCRAAKDISMAGTLGTALMLLECSRVGAQVRLDAIPRPSQAPLLRWLTAFPSFGFLLSVPPAHVAAVEAAFRARDLACTSIGAVTVERRLTVSLGDERGLLWDFEDEAFMLRGEAA